MKPVHVLLLAAALARPLPLAADSDPVARELAEIDRIGERMAGQLADAPEDRHDAIAEAFLYMVDKRADGLATGTDASDEQIDAFRDEAEAIGRDHGLID